MVYTDTGTDSPLEIWCTQIQVQTVHYRYGVHRYRYIQYIIDMVYTDTGTDSTMPILFSFV